MNEVLKVFKSKAEDSIDKKYDEKIIQIQQEDEIQKVLEDAKKAIENILESENKELDISSPILYTENTNTKVYNLLQEKQAKLNEINDICKEVEALFDLTTTYDEKIKILLNYNIIDKKTGKIIKYEGR